MQIIAELFEEGLATKQDIRELRDIDIKGLKDEIQKMEYRLVIKLGVIVSAAMTAMVAIASFLIKVKS